jgi:signal transduction histidine kinase
MLEIYQPTFDEHRHKSIVDLEDHLIVEADLGLLNRVLSNLIENEIAHLPAGRQILIRLRSLDGSAILVIEDDGPGFPPEISARAFERFVRGKQSQGHGLGLAFVDAVVRAHGGTVKISNSQTGGAIVFLSMPAKVLHVA